MATIRKRLSTRVDADGKAEVLLRFSGGRGMVFRLHSGIRVPVARWNARSEDVALPRIAVPEMPELLAARRKLDDLCVRLIEDFSAADRTEVTAEWLEDRVWRFHHPGRREAEDISCLMHMYVTDVGLSDARARHADVLSRMLARFSALRGKEIDVRSISSDDLRSFEDFLANEHAYAQMPRYRNIYKGIAVPGERGRNTIVSKIKMLRAFLSWCRKRGYTDADPFQGYEMKTEVYGTPWYLTIEEREHLAHFDLSARPALAVQRDIFIFQCLIGCRVSDLLGLKKSSVIGGAVEYIPRKTAGERPDVVRVPLSPSAAEIVARYADIPGEELLPFISPQKYNDAIKEAFTLAGLTRVVTVLDPMTGRETRRPMNEIASSHLARRTFIGNLYRQVKDPALVGALSGHKEGSRAFARYRTIDEGMKEELVALLEPEGRRGKV